MNRKLIECHDCSEETTILDQYDEIDSEDIKYCPYCGSENTQIIEKRKKNE